MILTKISVKEQSNLQFIELVRSIIPTLSLYACFLSQQGVFGYAVMCHTSAILYIRGHPDSDFHLTKLNLHSWHELDGSDIYRVSSRCSAWPIDRHLKY